MTKLEAPKIYRTQSHPHGKSYEPIYLVDDGRFYRTVFHCMGWSEQPDYELKADGYVYRTSSHPMGISATPDYQFKRDGLIHGTGNNQEGIALPIYEIRD